MRVLIRVSSMNTDTIRWTCGDERQMVGSIQNKLTALGFDRGDKNLVKCRLVGNSKDSAFSSANRDTKYIYYQLSFITFSTLVAVFDHSVVSVTLQLDCPSVTLWDDVITFAAEVRF